MTKLVIIPKSLFRHEGIMAELKRRKKVAYGCAEFGISGIEIFLRYYLLIFYTQTVGLRADLAGAAIGLAILWDAITDPLMGYLSDQTRTKWGRRKPYILVGGIGLALTTIILFSPPALTGQISKFIYLLVAYSLLNTAMTIINVPYTSLGGETTTDRHEVSEAYGWRSVFGFVGGSLAVMLPILALQMTIGSLGTESLASLFIAVAIIVMTLVTVIISNKELLQFGDRPRFSLTGFITQAQVALKNKAFLILMATNFVGMIAVSINMATAMFYYKYTLHLGDADAKSLVLTFTVSLFCSIFFWVYLSKLIGKMRALTWGVFLLGSVTTVVYLYLPTAAYWPAFYAAMVTGFLAGSTVLLDSILVEVSYFDQLRSNQHRLGVYCGYWKMSGKISRAISLSLTGFILQYLGFQGSTLGGGQDIQGLKYVFGPGVGSLLIAATVIICFFPLTDAKQKQLARILKQKDLLKKLALNSN